MSDKQIIENSNLVKKFLPGDVADRGFTYTGMAH